METTKKRKPRRKPPSKPSSGSKLTRTQQQILLDLLKKWDSSEGENVGISVAISKLTRIQQQILLDLLKKWDSSEGENVDISIAVLNYILGTFYGSWEDLLREKSKISADVRVKIETSRKGPSSKSDKTWFVLVTALLSFLTWMIDRFVLNIF